VVAVLVALMLVMLVVLVVVTWRPPLSSACTPWSARAQSGIGA
jgi:hypothetical protein